jgi:hypothetical protein
MAEALLDKVLGKLADAENGVKAYEVLETYKGKDRYVEIVNGEVKVLYLVGNKRYAKTSTYDAATGIYTVETTDGWSYYVKVVGDNVIIANDMSEFNA